MGLWPDTSGPTQYGAVLRPSRAALQGGGNARAVRSFSQAASEAFDGPQCCDDWRSSGRSVPHVAGAEGRGNALAHSTPVAVCVPGQQVCTSEELHTHGEPSSSCAQQEEHCKQGMLMNLKEDRLLCLPHWQSRRAHRIKEGVVEADLVEVLAAHDLSGKDRVCDAYHLHGYRNWMNEEWALRS